jgi:hypothetical protein
MRLASTRLWPFNRVLAFIWMVLVWCAYLLFLASAAQYPGRNLALTGSTGLLGVLAVSLIPLALSVIDLLAQQRGTLEFRGMKLDFAQGAAPSATATVAPNLGLPENLGLPVGDAGSRVLGSGSQEIIQGLVDSARRRVASLDLGDGTSWWVTRAYALCFGAAQAGNPKVVVFIGRDHGVPRRFLGWLYPEDFCRELEAKDDRYRQAREAALKRFRGWLAREDGLVEERQFLQELAARDERYLRARETALKRFRRWLVRKAGREKNPVPTYSAPSYEPFPNDPQARERFLLDELAKIEEEEHLQTRGRALLTVERLNEIAREYLRIDAIDLDASPERQVESFLEAEGEWIGLVRKGRYESLLARVDGERALLGQLIRASTRASAHA